MFDPNQAEYSLQDLTVYINIARSQIAIATRSLKSNGTLATVIATPSYAVSAIANAGWTAAGIAGTLNPTMAAMQVAAGPPVTRRYMELRSWQWFFSYYYSNINSQANAQPTIWSIQEPGPSGLLWLWPTPDAIYTITFDCDVYPIALADDTTVEALQYPWTDAVPYFAAYLAYLNSQREQDAEAMMARFAQFMMFASKGTTNVVLPQFGPGGRGALGAAEKISTTGLGVFGGAQGAQRPGGGNRITQQ